MILDDNHPDYYLSDTSANGKESAANDGKVIDFTPEGSGTSDPVPTGGDGEHRHGRNRLRRVLIWTIIVAVIVLGGAFYLRYCSPYVVDATVDAYVVSVEKRGLVFKTWEAQVVETSAVADTTTVYSHPLQFSVESDRLAHELQVYQGQRREVKLTYEKFYATLPWRGASKWVVTDVAGE